MQQCLLILSSLKPLFFSLANILLSIQVRQILGFLIQRKRYQGFLIFVNTVASLNHRDSWDLESSDYRPCDVLTSRLGDTFIQALTTSLPFLPLFLIGLIIHQSKRSKHRLYINVFKDVFKHVVGTQPSFSYLSPT